MHVYYSCATLVWLGRGLGALKKAWMVLSYDSSFALVDGSKDYCKNSCVIMTAFCWTTKYGESSSLNAV